MPARPSTPVEGKGKVVLVEQEDSSDDDAPSVIVRENAPTSIDVSEDDSGLEKESRGQLGLVSSGQEVRVPSTTIALCTEAWRGKDMLQYYLTRSLLEVSDQLSGVDRELSLELVLEGSLKEVTRKETDDIQNQLDVVRKELEEVNKKLLPANTKVDELTKELQDMPSIAQLEADNLSLSQEVNSLKDERESLWTLLSKLEEDVKNKQTREEELVKEVRDKKFRVEELKKEVDVLEIAALKVFYDFWKANPEENLDYLCDSKDMYLNFYVAQATKENPEATTSTAPTDQSTEDPTVQTDDSPTPSDQIDPYQEPGTPAV
uniref:Uncharacterized protein n=1 Tax=Cannabis sativa TaxID=3483 RepID=A0A803Q6V2_CANSA